MALGKGAPSLYYYILTMKHLAIALRQNTGIQGIPVGQRQYKLSLYADDLLLHVTNPMSLFSPFEDFGTAPDSILYK